MTSPSVRSNLRNIAIIAHVDHGKTTLVDCLLRQTGIFRENEVVQDCILDSNDLERERGITIFSKNCAIRYRDYKINIVDTPGHADFGGEVERVLGMVDGVLLLVDAFDGPMPQTTFVLRKALARGLKSIVVVNKVDRPGADPQDVLNRVYDLFIDLGANDEQTEFPVIFASGREGYACRELSQITTAKTMIPLLDTILESVKPPVASPEEPLSMLVTTVSPDPYLKKVACGRIISGKIKVGDMVAIYRRDGTVINRKVPALFGYEGLAKVRVEEVEAGDIAAVAGIDEIVVGETLTDLENPRPQPVPPIDDPTLALRFGPCTSPLAGLEGTFVTSRQIRQRLYFEAQNDLALKVEDTEQAEVLKVSGRGELHLSILIETMRREGYEVDVGRPEVILREIDGKKMEPYEYMVIDVQDEYAGAMIERVGRRKGQMVRMSTAGSESLRRLEFEISTRGTLGLRSELLTESKGTAVITHSFLEYRPFDDSFRTGRHSGVLVAKTPGDSVTFSMHGLQQRGTLFIGAGVPVYEGMIVGESSRDNDLDVNVCKTKHLTNMRTTSADEKLVLTPPRTLSLEQCLEFINDDELLEVTPSSLRLRKKTLAGNMRKVLSRQNG